MYRVLNNKGNPPLGLLQHLLHVKMKRGAYACRLGCGQSLRGACRDSHLSSNTMILPTSAGVPGARADKQPESCDAETYKGPHGGQVQMYMHFLLAMVTISLSSTSP